MAHSVKLSASIICADLLNLKDNLFMLKQGGIDYIHFDIMDGHFVPGIGLGTFFLRQISEGQSLPVETHLMVSDPVQYIDEIADAGASMVTFHYETGKDIYRTIDCIQKRDMRIGIALSPFTPLYHVKPFLDYLHMIVLMAYSPGTTGQRPVRGFEGRVDALHELLQRHGMEQIDIAVDGGVTEEHITSLVQHGANFFILGTSGLFMKNRTLKEQVARLQNIVQQL